MRPGARTPHPRSRLLEGGRRPAGSGRLVPAKLPLALGRPGRRSGRQREPASPPCVSPAPARPPEPRPRRLPPSQSHTSLPSGQDHKRLVLSQVSPGHGSRLLGTRHPRPTAPQRPGTCSCGSRANLESAENPGAGFRGHSPAAGSGSLPPSRPRLRHRHLRGKPTETSTQDARPCPCPWPRLAEPTLRGRPPAALSCPGAPAPVDVA